MSKSKNKSKTASRAGLNVKKNANSVKNTTAITTEKTLADQSTIAKITQPAKIVANHQHKQLDDRILTSGFQHGALLIRRSIKVLRKNLDVSIVMFILPGLLLILGAILVNNSKLITAKVLWGDLIILIGFVWWMFNALASYYFQLSILKGRDTSLLTIYRNSLRYMPRQFGALMLMAVLLVLGLVAFIIPGLIVLRRYFLVPFYIVDKDLGIREAMELSAAQTKPASWAVYGFLVVTLVFGVVNVRLGTILPPFGKIIGLCVVMLYAFAPGLLYKDIQAACGTIGATKKPILPIKN